MLYCSHFKIMVILLSRSFVSFCVLYCKKVWNVSVNNETVVIWYHGFHVLHLSDFIHIVNNNRITTNNIWQIEWPKLLIFDSKVLLMHLKLKSFKIKQQWNGYNCKWNCCILFLQIQLECENFNEVLHIKKEKRIQ